MNIIALDKISLYKIQYLTVRTYRVVVYCPPLAKGRK